MSYKTEEEAIKVAKQELENTVFTSFDGQNCEDECMGWDGESKRCECGNRRVSWEAYKLNNGEFLAYAVAY